MRWGCSACAAASVRPDDPVRARRPTAEVPLAGRPEPGSAQLPRHRCSAGATRRPIRVAGGMASQWPGWAWRYRRRWASVRLASARLRLSASPRRVGPWCQRSRHTPRATSSPPEPRCSTRHSSRIPRDRGVWRLLPCSQYLVLWRVHRPGPWTLLSVLARARVATEPSVVRRWLHGCPFMGCSSCAPLKLATGRLDPRKRRRGQLRCRDRLNPEERARRLAYALRVQSNPHSSGDTLPCPDAQRLGQAAHCGRRSPLSTDRVCWT